MSYKLVDNFRGRSGYSKLILFEICIQTCMAYTIGECIVNNS